MVDNNINISFFFFKSEDEIRTLKQQKSKWAK